MFKNLFVIDESNEIQKLILNTIDSVLDGNYHNIPENVSILIFMNLLMCYNKESIFDRFMQTQTSFIDASNFKINSTENWNCSNAVLRKQFFDKYNVSFHSKEDEDSYNEEWKNIVDIDDVAIQSRINYTYNIANMPFDSYTKKHIPIPIFMNCLRNANSHGRIKINGDNFEFYDKGNNVNAEPFFFMTISKEKLIEFLSNDYFIESILTNLDEHENEYAVDFYLLEKAESANDFGNYIDIYKNRMSNLNEIQVLKYMYDNNKFSAYLMEYPDQVESFLNYKLSNGISLIHLLKGFEPVSVKSQSVLKYEIECTENGLEMYMDFSQAKIEYLKKERTTLPTEFFEAYYSFMNNLKTFRNNIMVDEIEKLSDEAKEMVKNGGKELQLEFIDNDVILPYDSELFTRIMIEAGMQKIRKSELEKISVAVLLGKSKRKVGQSDTSEIKEKRHTIKNIEKHSSIANSFVVSSEKNLQYSKELAVRLIKVLAVNVGVRLFNYGYMFFVNESGLLNEPFLNVIMSISFYMSIFISNFSLRLTWKNYGDELEKMIKYNNFLDKYSDKELGDDNNEFRNNGSDHIRR